MLTAPAAHPASTTDLQVETLRCQRPRRRIEQERTRRQQHQRRRITAATRPRAISSPCAGPATEQPLEARRQEFRHLVASLCGWTRAFWSTTPKLSHAAPAALAEAYGWATLPSGATMSHGKMRC